MPNHVKPVDILEAAINAGVMKAHMPFCDTVIRGVYAGFFLGLTASFNYQLTALTGTPLVGALLFFVGFMMIIFYSLELVTGNMLLIPLAMLARRASWLAMIKNIITVYVCNFLGVLLYLAFFYGCFTHFGMIAGTDVKSGPAVIAAAHAKTVDYYNHGGLGWAACFFKGIICNFLVSFAVLGSLVSTSTVGKVVACWFPVAIFAVLSFEHVVINMYTISCSMVLGSGISQGLWWGWSLAPTTLGNIVGATLLVVAPMWYTHGHEYRQKQRDAKQGSKLSKSSSENELAETDIEAPSPTTNYPEGLFEQTPEEEASFDMMTGSDAVPNTPSAQHY